LPVSENAEISIFLLDQALDFVENLGLQVTSLVLPEFIIPKLPKAIFAPVLGRLQELQEPSVCPFSELGAATHRAIGILKTLGAKPAGAFVALFRFLNYILAN
jgi:hypothetical protein